jgi:transposase-like protein
MAETRRKFDQDFKEGAVRLVRETGRPVAQVAKDLGINEGTLGNWVNADKRRRGDGNGALSEDERAELACCGKRTPSWRWSVMCSSAVSPSGSRTRWGGSGGCPDRGPEG